MSSDTFEILKSDLPDMRDLPLDHAVEDIEYERTVRQIGVTDGGPSTPVSAFNSYI